MSSDWGLVTLGDLIALQRGHDLPAESRIAGNVPVMGSAGISGYHNKATTKGPGVVIGRSGVGSMGVVSFIDQDYWALNTSLYVTDFRGNDERYIYYLLRTINFRQFDTGSAQASLNRNVVYLHSVLVPNSMEERKRIGRVFTALDDRITLLRETNATLEAMAQALFKSWFVDFDPVHANAGTQAATLPPELQTLFPATFTETPQGLVPEGWSPRALDEIAEYLNGLALQKFPPTGENDLPVIKIAQLRKGDTVGADLAGRNIKPEYIIQDGDVLFSWSGSLEVEIWCGGEGALNQHLFKVTSKEYPKWFYYLWTRYHLANFKLIAASKATTMGHIQRKHLTEAMTVVPSVTVLNAANEAFNPMIEQLINNALQIRNLATLRDTLLPRLISGQLRLPEAEAALSEVAA